MKKRESGSDFAESIVNTIRESLIVLDRELRVVSASRHFYRQFKLTPMETAGRLIYEIGNNEWDIPQLRYLLEEIIPGRTTVEGFEIHLRPGDGRDMVLLLNARQLEQEGSDELILLAIEDITLQYTTRQKLAESEAKYRKFVEDINSIIIGIDLKGAITFFNHFSEKLFGYSRDEIIGKTFIGTIIPCIDSKGQDNSLICQEIFSNPTEYYANESEGVKKDGSRIVFSWSAKAIRDASGMVIEILIDGNDITELSSAQKKLEENSLTFDALLAFIPEGIIITDANRTVKKVSRYAGELFCVPPEQLVDIDESKLPGLLKLSWPNGEMIERSEDLPHSKVAATGETYTNYEIGFRHDSGIRTLSGTAAPIRDSQGTIIGTIGSWRDITDSKLLEKQLEDERDFVTAVIQTSGALITVIDMDGKITRFNKACEELTGYSADEVIGQSVFDLFIPQEESEVVIAVAERLFAGERWVDFENHWITKSGEKRFIRWRNSNLLDDRGTPALLSRLEST